MGDRRTIRGVDLAGRLVGDGDPTLVWGHGLTSSRTQEDDGLLLDWPRIEASTSVLRYDARGHGESGTTPDPHDYGWDRMALDQLELASSFGVERYVAGGASLGAATALHAAVTAPDRIVGLLLVIPPTGWETRAAQTGRYEQMASILDRKGTEPLIQAAATDVPIPDPFAGLGIWEQRTIDTLRAADPSRLATIFRGAATANLPPRDQVARIAVPTRILAWSGDAGHPVSSAEALADLIPGSELTVASTSDDLRSWTDTTIDFLGLF